MTAKTQDATVLRLTKLRTQLLLDEPFLGTLLMRLPMIEDPKCKTMWVNGVNIGWNRKFVEGHTNDEIKGTILHEVLHAAAGHCWRRDNRDFKDWNKACDYAINPIVVESGYKLPGGVLLSNDFKGQPAEQIYDAIHQPKQGSASLPQDGGEGDENESQQGVPTPGGEGDDSEDDPDASQPSAGKGDDEEGEGDGTDSGDDNADSSSGDQADDGDTGDSAAGDGEGDGSESSGSSGEGDDEIDPDAPVGEVRDAPADVDTEQLEREWKQAIEQAEKAAARRGKMPGELERVVKDILKPSVNWVEVLWQFVQQSWTAADYTWRLPSTRYLAQELYLPRLASETLPCIIMVTDTSASIWGRLLAGFQAEMSGIVDQMKPEEAYVVYADAAVQRVDRFEAGEPIVFNHVGGGGTDFRPVFEWVEKEGLNPVCMVYLTDLAGVFPEEEPPYPVLWISPPTQLKAPWGQHVEMRV